MSNQKIKSENYQNMGGINSKVSPYLTGPMEFLDLKNLDFQTPGSLSQRWGSTQYIGQTYPGPIHSVFEFARLDGSSYILQSFSGGIFYGATTGNCQGLSLTTQSATLSLYGVVSSVARQFILGQNYFVLSNGIFPINFLGITGGAVYGSNNGADGTTFYINPVTQSDNRMSYAVLNNFMFAADGTKFFKFDGVTTYPVGLPPVLSATSYAGGMTLTAADTSASLIGFAFGPSFGTYYTYASYVNNRGFEGPIWPLSIFFADTQFNATIQITPLGATGPNGVAGVTLSIATPLAYGISSINLYCFYDPYNSIIGQTYSNFSSAFHTEATQRFWNLPGPVLLSSTPATGSTLTPISFGVPLTMGQTLVQANLEGQFEPTNSYLPLGLTLISGTNATDPAQYVAIEGFYPKYLETYQNRLFLAGFSLTPSTIWFSDIAEPEGYAPDFNFEVRTNDGDAISAIKAYSTRFYIWKQRSFHILTGDNPNNFFLQEITDQYGCVNNRCTVVYDDILLFLDRRGVMVWNGAGISSLSDPKIKSIFDRMNYQAALTEACMVHDKIRNQILISIPVDGSTTNNLMVVYDYLVGAWTTYDTIAASSFAQATGRNTTRNTFYGDYQGRLNWFGASFRSDNGVGASTYLKTRFLHDDGESVTKTIRRLYLNADSPASSTLVFNVNFFKDYGSSVVLGTTIVLSQFQNRIDFGIQNAKAVAFEMSNLQTALPLRIHGFTIESRFMRTT